jgi:hypothetical protein
MEAVAIGRHQNEVDALQPLLAALELGHHQETEKIERYPGKGEIINGDQQARRLFGGLRHAIEAAPLLVGG